MGYDFHTPVLVKEVIDGLVKSNLRGGRPNVIVDATAGGLGHSAAFAQELAKNGVLVCIDQDAEALTNDEKLITNDGCKIEFVHDNFVNLKRILRELDIDNIDAILADLGVSSHQIDTAERGFSYTKDGPLDMRMNKSDKRDADHVVNKYSPARLEEIIREYGEEKFAKRITQAIVLSRPIKTTGELAKIIVDAVPGDYWRTGGHPAKRTFQAIRIEVNRELEVLEKFIVDAAAALRPGGRIGIITFHSLEDRIVKQTFKRLSTECLCPPKTPKCICGHKATLDLVTKKPIEPTDDEVRNNPRAASAKLRIAERRRET